jgi:AcrR family transcriptional regulator
MRLFIEQGYRETTVEQIAAASDISPSTFFRYFPTKEDTVLTELIDSRTIELAVAAPAEFSPIAALGFAVETAFAQMSDEELVFEFTRNQLIATVPELQRGMLAEITRPMQMFAAATATRTGRRPDDPDLLTFAGAVVGGLLATTASLQVGSFVPAELGPDEIRAVRGLMISLREAITGLERIVMLPPAAEPSDNRSRAVGMQG